MIKRKNAILKIGILCIIFFFALSIVVLGDKVNLSTVKIQFANGSEINIFTTKSKVADILVDANIILLETETVSPDLEENLNEEKKICNEYEKNFGPMTLDSDYLKENNWIWLQSNWPWEGTR